MSVGLKCRLNTVSDKGSGPMCECQDIPVVQVQRDVRRPRVLEEGGIYTERQFAVASQRCDKLQQNAVVKPFRQHCSKVLASDPGQIEDNTSVAISTLVFDDAGQPQERRVLREALRPERHNHIEGSNRDLRHAVANSFAGLGEGRRPMKLQSDRHGAVVGRVNIYPKHLVLRA